MNDTDISSDLSSIAAYLSSQGYQVKMQPAEPPLILEQVLVSLGKGYQHMEMILRIAGIRGEGELLGKSEFEQEYPADFKFLQFTAAIPVIAEESMLGDLSRYILTLNASLDMAQFGLMEKDRMVFYRYVYVCPAPKMNGSLLIPIVTSVQFLLDMFLAPIVDIAQGKKTCSQLLHEAEKALKKLEIELMQ